MSQDAYRNDLQAARLRISELETELSAQRDELATLTEELEAANARSRLVATASIRRAASRPWKLAALGLLAVSLCLGLLLAVLGTTQSDTDEGPRAHDPRVLPAPSPTLADPLDEPRAGEPAADVRGRQATLLDGDPFNEKTGASSATAEKAILMKRMRSGTASEAEVRMLRALCIQDDDRGCRNEATAALKVLR